MKKIIPLLSNLLFFVSGASLLMFNLLHFSYEAIKFGGFGERGGASGPVAITGYYYYEEGYIIGATIGVALIVAGYMIRKFISN